MATAEHLIYSQARFGQLDQRIPKQQPTVREPIRQFQEHALGPLSAIQTTTRAFLDKLSQLPKQILLKTGKFNSKTDIRNFWTSDPYVNRFRTGKYSLEEIKQVLAVDIQTFLDESVAYLATKSYPRYTKHGIESRFKEAISELGKLTEAALASQGKDIKRAKIETAVMEQLEEWLNDPKVPVGAKLVWVSPPGNEGEGYRKEDMWNYINIYIKIKPGECQFLQYINFDTLEELEKLLLYLNEQCNGSTRFEYPEQEQFIPAHAILATLISLPEFITINQIEQRVFLNQEAWGTKFSDLPEINQAQFKQQSQTIIDFCLHQAESLLTANGSKAVSGKKMAGGKKIDPYFVVKFDALIATVREVGLKWVDQHAENYNDIEQQANYAMPLDQIKAEWLRKCKQTEGQSLTKKEKKARRGYLQAVTLPTSSPLRQLSRLIPCPSMLMQNPALLKSVNLENLSRAELANYVGKQKAKNWQSGICKQCGARTLLNANKLCLACVPNLDKLTGPGSLKNTGQAKFQSMANSATTTYDRNYDPTSKNQRSVGLTELLAPRRAMSIGLRQLLAPSL